MRILIIEENRDIRDSLEAVLQGEQVTMAGTPKEALGCLKDNSYDAILVDQRTRTNFGLSVDLFGKTPVVFMTTVRELPPASWRVLKKPFCIQDLAATLEIAL